MSRLPTEVLERIESREGEWSAHATQVRASLGLEWHDVVSAARTAESWKREADEQEVAVDGRKDSFVGRDSCGQMLYVTGKWVYFRGENCWYVVTIRQHKRETVQRPKARQRS